jgi:uncharacterized protein YbjT (DUF2867 family)
METMTAVVVGGTGLVGTQLTRLLLGDERFGAVVLLGRRPHGVKHPKVREHVIDFERPAAWRELVAGDVLFSALGTTIKKAGSREAQHRVDHGYQFGVAEAARGNGVPAFVLVSSGGADPRSRIFYSRMKGELERDVAALRFPRLRILRPGPLDGDRQEYRAGEEWALRMLRPLAPVLPWGARPIPAATVARAAIAAALDPAPGVKRYGARELFRLGAAEREWPGQSSSGTQAEAPR